MKTSKGVLELLLASEMCTMSFITTREDNYVKIDFDYKYDDKLRKVIDDAIRKYIDEQ